MREKLIELLGTVFCNGNGESLGSCPDRKHGLCGEVANLSYCVIRNIANHLIANGVTVQQWIPASEPPKEKGRYWCNVKSFSFPGKYYQTVLKWDDGFIEGSIYTDDVTHWMPLPEPPKEG